MTETPPEVLILGGFLFPEGGGAHFVRGLAKTIQHAGYPVQVLAEGDGRPEDRTGPDTFAYRGVSYRAAGPAPRSRSRLVNLAREYLALNNPTLRWLERLHRDQRKIIVAHQAAAAFLGRVRRTCQARKLPCVGLIVEWLDWRHLRQESGRTWPLDALDTRVQMTSLWPRFRHALCISQHLTTHFRARGVNTLALPPLLDLQEDQWANPPANRPRPPGGPLRLLFSGPLQRDRQDLILHGLRVLRGQRCPVQLEYTGTTADALARFTGTDPELLRSLEPHVRLHGRLDLSHYYCLAREVDFAILLRDDARWSRACFPSRVPELLAFGVPMLCNLTSDLGHYLEDGKNALLVPELSVEAFVTTVKRAIQLGPEGRLALRAGARHSAARFDAATHAPALREYLAKL